MHKILLAIDPDAGADAAADAGTAVEDAATDGGADTGGDAGSAERYYAPGVGLVYEQITAEESQQTLKLVSYQLK